MNRLPKDPMILLGVINTKLRDYYPSLEELCEDMQISSREITAPLKSIEYRYDKEQNQFI